MRNKKALPYYGSSSVVRNVVTSSKFRNQNYIVFIAKKFFNYLLGLMAYSCPVNNLRVKFHKWRGVNIGRNIFIGLRCTLDHAYPEYIYIEDNVILSGDIYIVAHNKPSVHYKRKIPSFVAPVILKKNVFIGVRAVVMPGVIINEGSFVSGGSVISEDVPANVIVKGNPAQIIHKL